MSEHFDFSDEQFERFYGYRPDEGTPAPADFQPNFSEWIAYYDAVEDYWAIAPKIFWEKNKYIPDHDSGIRIPGFYEGSEHLFRLDDTYKQLYGIKPPCRVLQELGFQVIDSKEDEVTAPVRPTTPRPARPGEDLVGKVCACSLSRPGLVVGKAEFSWGVSWVGLALDENSRRTWASREPFVVAETPEEFYLRSKRAYGEELTKYPDGVYRKLQKACSGGT